MRRVLTRGTYSSWWKNLRERDHLQDLGVDGRIILNRIFRKWCGDMNGLIWLTIGQGDKLL